MGLKRLKVAPVPAKADVEKQKIFLKEELEPRIEQAKKGERHLLFVDAAHFVLAAFLGFLWCFTRVIIKSPSGRQRFNVLGAFDAMTQELVTVTNNTYINALSMIDLMEKLITKYTKKLPITLVLDNAKYQKCQIVMDFAKENNIELLYLPSYSPNLNLIERLWKFTKKKCLYCKYYENFSFFKEAISNCLNKVATDYKSEICSLMTLNFHIEEGVKL